MAALVLTTVTSSLAGSFGITGFAATALTAGAGLVGGAIDQMLFAKPGADREGPRLDTLHVTASTEGTGIPRIYGRMRVGASLIWATRLEEDVVVTTEQRSGKGGGGSAASTTTYQYYANLALALCEGPIAHVGRVWADGKELDLTQVGFRVHRGSDSQLPDPLIEAKEGLGNAPAYRGIAYVVFERLPLEPYGNRIPQLTFEVWCPLGTLEDKVRQVCVIPGATEFGYDPLAIDRVGRTSSGQPIAGDTENRHTFVAASNWSASMDLMQALLPACGGVTLVTTWYGDDLRAAHCTLRPKVENPIKDTHPYQWTVAGLARADAQAVTQVNGKPAYGGTPNDASLMRAIADLKARGKRVTLMPFLMMDIAPDNTLPDPYGAAAQAAHPWRGRITCDPAPGQPATADRTAAAGSQIAGFVGATSANDFVTSAETVTYTGPDPWTYRHFILHHAHLAKAAGGVDTFLIGSEMVRLTTVRDAADAFTFVQGLKALAADVRAILGPDTEVGYAADWSEYHSHRPPDGSGDVLFHLDALWSDANIDFIGIDNYLPLADWRDGADHADRVSPPSGSAPQTGHESDYLAANIEGGEYYDWYYASSADRTAGLRTPINDGAHSEHWIFRQKDIAGWWSSAHHDRPAGVRSATPTDWVPASKPIRFTELGCGAIDKGSNAPNLFLDPKSSENALPVFSRGTRDDLQQRRHLEAVIDYWAPSVGNNPVSAVYAGPMIDPAGTALWCWDARPVPAFPRDRALWADAANWDGGHWLSGRLGTVTLQDAAAAVIADYTSAPLGMVGVTGTLDGLAISGPATARSVLEPLLDAFGADLVQSGEDLVLRGRHGRTAELSVDGDDAVLRDESDTGHARLRVPDAELPATLRINLRDPDLDDATAAIEATRANTGARGVATLNLPVALERARAGTLTRAALQAAWTARERLEISLPPTRLALEPGDVFAFADDSGTSGDMRVTRIVDGAARTIEAVRFDTEDQLPVRGERRSRRPRVATAQVPPVLELLDLPALDGVADTPVVYAAAQAAPWRPVALYRAQAGGARSFIATLERPATMGSLLEPLGAGALWRFDEGGHIDVELFAGSLDGQAEIDVLGGANLAAIQASAGGWEIIQFRGAELIAARTYRLTGLLRGQGGSEHLVATTRPAGSRFVLINEALTRIPMTLADVGRDYVWRYGPANRHVTEAHYQDVSFTPEGTALKPRSPVHLTAVRSAGSDDIAIGWIRRTRATADPWQEEDVPLGETSERYHVQILATDGETLLRQTETTSPSLAYPAAEQIADFGSMPTSLTLSVAQVSDLIGAGPASRRTFDV